MTVLNLADALYLGSTPIDKIYLGAALVWVLSGGLGIGPLGITPLGQ